jgi:hypothetical protein
MYLRWRQKMLIEFLMGDVLEGEENSERIIQDRSYYEDGR